MRAETSRFGPVGGANTGRLATDDTAAAILATLGSFCLAPRGLWKVASALSLATGNCIRHARGVVCARRCPAVSEPRLHATLRVRTWPDFKRRAANQQPRIGPSSARPRWSPCAKPQTLVANQPGARFTLQVDFQHTGRKHSPVATLQRAA